MGVKSFWRRLGEMTDVTRTWNWASKGKKFGHPDKGAWSSTLAVGARSTVDHVTYSVRWILLSIHCLYLDT